MKIQSALLWFPILAVAKQSSFTSWSNSIPGESPVELCGDDTASNIVNITYLNVLPNPPIPGEPLNVEARAIVKETIEEGAYVQVEVKYGYIKLLNQQMDLCENLAEVDMKCPVKAGEVRIIKAVDLPKEIPPGKYKVNAKAFTKEDKVITCLQAEVSFSARR